MSERRYVTAVAADQVATVTIDRQRKLNALNPEVISEIDAVFAEIGDDQAVRAVVLTGAGERAFVAGADIGVLAKIGPHRWGRGEPHGAGGLPPHRALPQAGDRGRRGLRARWGMRARAGVPPPGGEREGPLRTP